jgi:sarcosine oxidase
MYDAVVVGLGGVGSFALRALTREGGKQGGKFLGIERFSLGHAKGSSHGRSRIYRRAYYEHPSYVPWIDHSIKVFGDLQKQSSAQNNTSNTVNKSESMIMQECGLLTVAPKINHGNIPDLVQSTLLSSQIYGIEVEEFDANGLRERFPQLRYEDDMVGVFEPMAGFVRPERVLKAVQEDFIDSPGITTIMENTIVKSVQPVAETGSRGHVRIMIQQEGENEPREILTRSLLISAGSWAADLLPASWSKYLTATRQLQAWIDMSSTSDKEQYSADNFPAWIMQTPHWPITVYGLPGDPHAIDGSSQWIKFSSHGRNDVLHPPINNPKTVSDTELNELEQIARVSFSAWQDPKTPVPKLADCVPCMYTMTSDSHFLIGSPMDNVFAVAGLSGHGFKMTPALGQMMADFGLGKDMSEWKLDFYSPRRFDK